MYYFIIYVFILLLILYIIILNFLHKVFVKLFKNYRLFCLLLLFNYFYNILNIHYYFFSTPSSFQSSLYKPSNSINLGISLKNKIPAKIQKNKIIFTLPKISTKITELADRYLFDILLFINFYQIISQEKFKNVKCEDPNLLSDILCR